jgi:subtilisin family serine protease
VVNGQIGPIVTGRLDGAQILHLAPSADLIEAPQPLRPLLDMSRVAIRADQLDQGRNLPGRFRGHGVIIAAYDTGVDLAHPDLRTLAGQSRVIGLWDQAASGTPPRGHHLGNACSKAQLMSDACNTNDPAGHGTHVLAVAASNGPQYRGIAPEASLVVARSNTFDSLVETLAWFDETAVAEEMPMVVNLSIGGHQGAHDGTSLEAQAIDAYRHLVVAAAGNEGVIAVHTFAALSTDNADAVLRFPSNGRSEERAIVDIWGDGTKPLTVQALIIQKDGTVLARSGTIAVGGGGHTDTLRSNNGTFGTVHLDAEAGPNPFNGKSHISLAIDLTSWQDAPAGPGYFVTRLSGDGRVDLWVDSPAAQSTIVRFDQDNVLGSQQEVAGDNSSSVSDPATAVAAIAVSAYIGRVSFPSMKGTVSTGGMLGVMAPYSSFGPTLAADKTGPKPDIAAPGDVVIAAKSRSAPIDDNTVSPLYRVSAGTSVAAPHVVGTAALVLAARPSTTKEDLKRYLLRTAVRDGSVDPRDSRWGAGKLDALRSVEGALTISEGCACTSTAAYPSKRLAWLALLLSLTVHGGGRKRS